MKTVARRTGYAHLTREDVQQAVQMWLQEKHGLYIESHLDVDIDEGAAVKLWSEDEDYDRLSKVFNKCDSDNG